MEKIITKKPLIKIAVVGPESTGKSVLAKALATHYHTAWVPEFSREYCSKLNRPCTMADELAIFRGQLDLEEKLIPQANRLLICDTTIITVKVWCEHVFGTCPPEVQDELDRRNYDLYLLMDIDLPWTDDPLRDFPGLREHFMEVYRTELKAMGADFRLISGTGPARFEHAIETIERYLAAHSH